MAVQVTRCPHCQTSFRVQDEHLSAAQGMVRCGSCLQVFKAADYFVAAPSATPNTAPSTTPSATPKAPATAAVASNKTAAPAAKPVASSKPAAAPSNKTAAPSAKPQAPASKPAAAAPTAAKTPAPVAKPSVKPAAKPSAKDDDLGLIHDDMDDDKSLTGTPLRRASPIELEIDRSVFDLDDVDPDSFDAKSIKNEDDDDEKVDESWAAALLDEPLDKKAVASKKTKGSAFSDDFNFDLPAKEPDDFQGFLDDDSVDDSAYGSVVLGSTNSLKKTVAIDVKSVKLQPEPIRVQQSRTKTRNHTAWLWPTACGLLVLLALVQTLYFRFDTLARTPSWRPYYAQWCDWVDCALPTVQNMQDISSQNLVVRPHPKYKGALMIDALLLNKAAYSQPFPDVRLMFKDLNERLVASRSFSPSQYLSGELAGQNDMPSHTPIHIAFEILDPGPEAVSYSLTLVENQ